MFANYFSIAVRNLKNSLMYTALNVTGLSIGIGCILITALFVMDQYSYDTQNTKADRIYRIVNKQERGNRFDYVAVTQGTLAPELLKVFPEVVAATRVEVASMQLMPQRNQEQFAERILAVDSAYFSIFTLPFSIAPSAGTISNDAILISESASKRLFGDDNPIGEIINMEGIADLTVTGVFQDIPYQSHLKTNFIVSFYWIEKTEPNALSWSDNSYYNYILVPREFDKGSFNAKMNEFIHQHTPASWKSSVVYFLQPLLSIHLQAGYQSNAFGSLGRILVMGFAIIGIIILALASFNYMNLATARSLRRAREVGIRKTMGANRFQLIFQFLFESFILCTLGFLLGILWADIGATAFNTITGYKLEVLDFFTKPSLLVSALSGLILLTLLAGSYPAFFLSRFRPAAVLKGQHITDSSKRMRKGLVLVQFGLTTMLIILLVLVYKQTNFLRNHELGFNKNDLLLFTADRNTDIGLAAFKGELLGINGVKQVAVGSQFPTSRMSTINVWESGASETESLKAEWLFVDHDYIPTLELKVIEGRNFSSSGNDEKEGLIINEKAAEAFGWTPQEAIGKRISGFAFSDDHPGEVIGVIQNFHVTSLRKPITSLVVGYNANQSSYMVRLDGGNQFDIRDQIDKTAPRFTRNNSYDPIFMEDAIDQAYAAEERSGEFLTLFTFLAIFIGCSGLYALSAFETERRVKELGIRKIIGASTMQLIVMLSKDFLRLIIISLAIGMPLAYYLGNIWLRPFAYRISWSIDIFFVSATSILFLGWLTISTQAIKASNKNPADALKHD